MKKVLKFLTTLLILFKHSSKYSTIMNWIDNSIKEYYDWLREKTFVTKDERTGWSAISTPFLGLFNDSIEIYAKLENGIIILSDDGLTLNNLELAGSPVTRSPKRKEWMEMVLLNYGVSLIDNELQTSGNEKDFPQKKHNLICAISEINFRYGNEYIV